MKFIPVCLAVMITTGLFAQSKKELVAEVNKLKAEIEQLKKPKEADLTDKHKKAGYGIGVLMATNLKPQMGDSLNVESLLFGIRDVLENKTVKMTPDEAMGLVQPYMTAVMERKNEQMKKDNAAYLESNKTKEGVKTTASGLQYKVITTGKGKAPAATSSVTVHYTGKLVDGTVFDSSVERGEPATFTVNEVIPGWTEALQLMHEGDKWELYIPYDLAYGERGAGSQIPPYATLVFEVELIKIN